VRACDGITWQNVSIICDVPVCLITNNTRTPQSPYSDYLCCCNNGDYCNDEPGDFSSLRHIVLDVQTAPLGTAAQTMSFEVSLKKSGNPGLEYDFVMLLLLIILSVFK
jgi:hypothetical protein